MRTSMSEDMGSHEEWSLYQRFDSHLNLHSFSLECTHFHSVGTLYPPMGIDRYPVSKYDKIQRTITDKIHYNGSYSSH